MSELLIEDRRIVVPGEVLAHGLDFLPGQGTYRLADKILASRLGIASVNKKVIRIIPVSGQYIPKKGDVVIGQVIDIGFNSWRLTINSPYSAMLSVMDATSRFVGRGADMTQFFNLGDYVVAKITNVTSQKLVDLTTKGPGLRKLGIGRIVNVNTNKVPRIIGKQGSMVKMIKDATGAQIIVGQNGVIWISCPDPDKEIIAVQAIKKIEEGAHVSGLTDIIKKHLDSNVK